jgi:hypothetical protein
MILYLDAVARNGTTVVDSANGPRQRIQPYQDTVALLEILGAKNIRPRITWIPRLRVIRVIRGFRFLGNNGDRDSVSGLMLKFLLWCILFVLCWPFALVALVAYPFIWLMLLPFRLIGVVVSGVLHLIWSIITLPMTLFRRLQHN